MFKKISEKELLKTPIFDVVEKEFEGTNFKPIGINCPDWVLVHIYDEYGQVLVKQTRWGIEEETIEFPCGIVEPNEDPEDAAKRELEEETGLSDVNIQFVDEFNPNPACFKNKMYVFEGYVPDLENKLKAHKELKLDEHEDCVPFFAHKHYRMTDTAITLAVKKVLCLD